MAQDQTCTLSPPLREWPDVIAANRRRYDQLDPSIMAGRMAARQRLLDAANRYTTRLDILADEAGLSVPRPDGDRRILNPSQADLVVTGHQPTLMHPGITYKYETVDRYLQQRSAVGIAITIDTDHGDLGQFAYPVASPLLMKSSPEAMTPASIRFATYSEPDIYCFARLQPTDAIKQTATEVADSLCQLKRCDVSRFTQSFAQQLIRLSAVPAMDAMLILRRAAGIGTRMLELPLSELSHFPETVHWIHQILSAAPQFHAAYNEQLARFRTERQIRNRANPFPDLEQRDQTLEMPFWLIDHRNQSRQPAWIHPESHGYTIHTPDRQVARVARSLPTDTADWLPKHYTMVPRHAMITALFRTLYSDLFVHGTGGERYDQFTNALIRLWWNIETPQFAVASTTRHLFPDQASQVHRLRQLRTKERDISYHPQRYFGQEVLSSEAELDLKQLVQHKHEAVQELKRRQAAGISAAEIGQQLQMLSDRMRQIVAVDLQSHEQSLKKLSTESIEAITYRSYPYFMFNSLEARRQPNQMPSQPALEAQQEQLWQQVLTLPPARSSS